MSVHELQGLKLQDALKKNLLAKLHEMHSVNDSLMLCACDNSVKLYKRMHYIR